jgi:hypothetical protein
MLRHRRRLARLEKSALFQPPPDASATIASLALQELSDEHLELLSSVAGNREKGLCWTLSREESAALKAYEAAWDLKCPAGVMQCGNRKAK